LKNFDDRHGAAIWIEKSRIATGVPAKRSSTFIEPFSYKRSLAGSQRYRVASETSRLAATSWG
jgi:hypothetical protein